MQYPIQTLRVESLPCATVFSLIVVTLFFEGSGDSAGGIATGYGLDDLEVGVRVPVGSRIHCSCNNHMIVRISTCVIHLDL
jgi:hypothetical protein